MKGCNWEKYFVLVVSYMPHDAEVFMLCLQANLVFPSRILALFSNPCTIEIVLMSISFGVVCVEGRDCDSGAMMLKYCLSSVLSLDR